MAHPVGRSSHFPLTQVVSLGLVLFCCSTLFTVASAAPASAALFKKWTADIEKTRKSIGVQGLAVSVVYKGEIIYAKGFGKRNDVDPFTPDTLTNIASISKGFTAGAVGELVARKKASWDVPVSHYLPEFQLKNPFLTAEINFVDLLAHRTGAPSLDKEWFHRPESRNELIRELKYVDFQAPLRTKFLYNNIMYAVAGEAAERITGKRYEDLVREMITRPLGMNRTDFDNVNMIKQPNHALPYSCKNWAAAQKGQTHRVPIDLNYLADGPSGAMYSNVIDLASWAKAIMHFGKVDGKQVLSEENVKALRSAFIVFEQHPRSPEFSVGAYGLGFETNHYKGRLMVHHPGWNYGFRSKATFFPDDDLAVITLSNSHVNQLPEFLPYYIADDLLDLPKTQEWLAETVVADTKKWYGWVGAEDPTSLEWMFPPQIKGTSPTRKLAEFAGEYHSLSAGKIIFELVKKKRSASGDDSDDDDDDEEYALAFQYVDHKGVMDHYHYDTFRLRLLGSFTFANLVTFKTGRNGKVEGLEIFEELEKVPVVYTKVK